MVTPATTAEKAKPAASKKRRDLKLESWVLHVQTTDNNTILALVDENGNRVLGWGTGKLGYKGSKKSTPYAAELLTKQLLKEAQGFGLKEIGVIFRWTWLARDGIFKAINEIGLIDIKYIKENTAIQFGGCKWRRQKRV